ncbi:transporter [Seongchinamella sediminis]|uniref:Transporter n=1 Tax=Seongchinamella sediminis TaxID=2283635 RepID=A0A3L7DWZ5_9GAMM|nr:transporter [Seongchinamella sediminis]RLQ21089.1 transporter [Seongchinamella sediminis]
MQEVAVIGVGMHRFGKTGDDIVGTKSVGELCRTAVDAALKDAGVSWKQIQAVTAASSRFSGGKGWGLNGNDVVEDLGSTGIPVYNMSAGCAAGGNAFNVGYSMVAGGVYDIVLVVGGEVMPKGMIQTSGVEEATDPEFLRQRCIGMPGPSFWSTLARRRMYEYGTTEEQFSQVAVKARQCSVNNPYARFQQAITLEDVMNSPYVSNPLRLFQICPVSNGAAAAIICSSDYARKFTSKPVTVATSTVATMTFDDMLPRGLADPMTDCPNLHTEARNAVTSAFEKSGIGPEDISFTELQDNTCYYELAFPEEWGLCEPGQSESLLKAGETAPTGSMPINPSGGFVSFGEATTAMGVFQIAELTWQLRGQAGGRQVPGARVGLAQTLGLGGNATAAILKR